MSRKLVLLLSFTLAGLAVALLLESPDEPNNHGLVISPCEQPISYSVGSVDQQFDLKTERLVEILEEVEALWSKAAGRNLADFDQNGDIVINLVYDDRQRLIERERDLAGRIETERLRIQRLEVDYERLNRLYETQLTELESTVELYNRKVEEYDRYRNGQNPDDNRSSDTSGPKEKLLSEIDKLQSEIEQKSVELEKTRQNVNRGADRINAALDHKTDMITEYNEEFSSGYRFHQGEFSREGNKGEINIYKFEDENDLRLILAHEMGHALGLGHVKNPESIMYHLMQLQEKSNLKLSGEDRSAIRQLCD